ncbi:MAG: PAS domain-containing protein, partial [Acidobacteriota bacterium]
MVDQTTPRDDLSGLSRAQIDSLPFGYIALAPDGTIRKYNRYEADLAGTDPEEVLGKSFFRDVAPCTQVQEFEGRFRRFASGELAEPTLTFDFEFAFRRGTQAVRIGFVRSPLDREVIVTVNRVRRLDLALSPEIEARPVEGVLRDAGGERVVAAHPDLWRSLDRALDPPGRSRGEILHHMGYEWGMQHALRVETLVQRRQLRTLRETELQMALETLSGSIGVQGLGRFDVGLGLRRRGLLLVQHHGSPFAPLYGAAAEGAEPSADPAGSRCALLAGLHAGFLSYLAGRPLVGREIACGGGVDGVPCRFVVGTASRIEKLL